MYVIKMDEDKTLTTTNSVKIYQYDSSVDKILFLVPDGYADILFSECIATLWYVTPDGATHSETLEMSPERYKGYCQYEVDLNIEMTRLDGKIELWLVFTNAMEKTVLQTGVANLVIRKSKSIHDYSGV